MRDVPDQDGNSSLRWRPRLAFKIPFSSPERRSKVRLVMSEIVRTRLAAVSALSSESMLDSMMLGWDRLQRGVGSKIGALRW